MPSTSCTWSARTARRIAADAAPIWFSRIDLQLARQMIFDEAGNILTDARYSEWRSYDNVHFPKHIEINRPRDEYGVVIDVVKMDINKGVSDDKFVLKQPPGSHVAGGRTAWPRPRLQPPPAQGKRQVTDKLVLENLKHRPMRSLLSILLIGVPVTLILCLVGLSTRDAGGLAAARAGGRRGYPGARLERVVGRQFQRRDRSARRWSPTSRSRSRT